MKSFYYIHLHPSMKSILYEEELHTCSYTFKTMAAFSITEFSLKKLGKPVTLALFKAILCHKLCALHET